MFLRRNIPLLGVLLLARASVAIDVPINLSPCFFPVDPALPVNIVWSNVGGATSYNLQVSQDPFFTFVSQDLTVFAPNATVFGLFYSASYSWRVRASDGVVWSAWSTPCTFTTIALPAPPAPVLQAPANNSIGLSTTVGLQWSNIPATSIEVQVATEPLFLSPTIINTGGQNHTLTGLANAAVYYWRVRGSNIGGTGPWSSVWNFTVSSLPVATGLRMYLQGPWNTTTLMMNDDLRAAGLVPTSEPYTGLGTAGLSNAGATVGAGVLGTSGPNAVVDWVVIEARHATAPTVLRRWAALLQRDGDVMMPDGSAPNLVFPVPTVRLAIRHRNHLGCMAAASYSTSAASIAADFTLPATALYGTDATATVSGSRALWAGDVMRNDNLQYTGANNDRDPILSAIGGTVPTATIAGYRIEDVNLDGQVKYTGPNNDRDIILVNIGGTVPTAIRTAQLP